MKTVDVVASHPAGQVMIHDHGYAPKVIAALGHGMMDAMDSKLLFLEPDELHLLACLTGRWKSLFDPPPDLGGITMPAPLTWRWMPDPDFPRPWGDTRFIEIRVEGVVRDAPSHPILRVEWDSGTGRPSTFIQRVVRLLDICGCPIGPAVCQLEQLPEHLPPLRGYPHGVDLTHRDLLLGDEG